MSTLFHYPQLWGVAQKLSGFFLYCNTLNMLLNSVERRVIYAIRGEQEGVKWDPTDVYY